MVTTYHSAWPGRVSPPNAAPAHGGLPAHDTLPQPKPAVMCSSILSSSLDHQHPIPSQAGAPEIRVQGAGTKSCSTDQTFQAAFLLPGFFTPSPVSTFSFCPNVHAFTHWEPLKDLNPAPPTMPTTREQTGDWDRPPRITICSTDT